MMEPSKAPIFTTVKEQNRTYYFPNGEEVTVAGVVGINVSKSGTHRLDTSNGKKHIVAPGWLHISFDADGWSF